MTGREPDKRAHAAIESLRAGRSGEAKAFLESIRAHESNNPRLMFLHAYASVLSDDLGASLLSLERLKQRFPAYVPGKELHAFMRFKAASDRDQAAAPFIELSADGVKSRHIKKIIKNIRSVYDFHTFQRTLTLDTALPLDELQLQSEEEPVSSLAAKYPVRKRRNIRIPVKGMLVGCVIVSIAAALFVLIRNTDFGKIIPYGTNEDNSALDRADISSGRYPVVDTKMKQSVFIYQNETALRNDYEKARQLIKDGNAEDALLIINYIRNSNAQLLVRDRAAFLANYIAGLENRTPKTVEITTLADKPLLWQGALVIIKGTVVSIEKKSGDTLMVLKGKADDAHVPMVNLFYNGDLSFKPDENIQVTGIFTQVIGKEKRPYIEVRSALRY